MLDIQMKMVVLIWMKTTLTVTLLLRLFDVFCYSIGLLLFYGLICLVEPVNSPRLLIVIMLTLDYLFSWLFYGRLGEKDTLIIWIIFNV